MVDYRHVYGPVYSRRLGRSLGIDLTPYKTCSYDCVYCQLGRTTVKTLERKPYVAADIILGEVAETLKRSVKSDYITLSGSGEPTLNSDLGLIIKGIRNMSDIPVAVITNGSLLWRNDVRDELMLADLVIPSLDAGNELSFEYVNRPCHGLTLDKIVEGMCVFREMFKGSLWLEVFLLYGLNSTSSEVEKIAALAEKIAPDLVQLNTVLRPPSETFAEPVPLESMLKIKDSFSVKTEIIMPYENYSGTVLSESEASEEEIMSMILRRPCTAEDISEGLGIHIAEVIKLIDRMLKKSVILIKQSGLKNYIIPDEINKDE